MYRRKIMRFLAGALCGVMLITSEGMSGLAYAASEPQVVSVEETGKEEATGTEMPAESGAAENPSGGEDKELSEDKQTDETTEESGESSTETGDSKPGETPPQAENPEGNPAENSEGNPTENPEGNPTENPEGNPAENPEGDAAEEETPPEENLFKVKGLEENSEASDFIILDEKGAELAKNADGSYGQILMTVNEEKTLRVKLLPEGAVTTKEITWQSGSANLTVTDGTLTAKAASEEPITVTVSLGDVQKTFGVIIAPEIEELPEATDFEIVDEKEQILSKKADGSYAQISMIKGEQRKFDLKLLPEGAVAKTVIRWNSSSSNLTVSEGILTANKASDKPVTVTVTGKCAGELIKKTFEVLIKEPDANDLTSLQCGGITVGSMGIWNITKISDKEWSADIDEGAELKLESSDEFPNLYYCETGQMQCINRRLNAGKRYYDTYKISFSRDTTFQVAAIAGPNSNLTDDQIDGIYTIHFKVAASEFKLRQASKAALPGETFELEVKSLPGNCNIADIEWSSGHEKIAKIGEKTENGVMVQAGTALGETKITAKATDNKNRCFYAVCTVRVTMKLRSPAVETTAGGYTVEENSDGETIDEFWRIDQGGRVTLSVKGAPDADIYYTLDGSAPTENSSKYAGPIAITKALTLKTFAKREGYEDSEIEEYKFKLGTSKLTLSAANLTVEQGKEKEIKITEKPTGASAGDVEFSSSNPAVAEVEWIEITKTVTNEEGDEEEVIVRSYWGIKGIGAGKCTITASVTDYADRTVNAECIVNVPRKVGNPVFTPDEESGHIHTETKEIMGPDEDGDGEPDDIEVIETNWVIVDKGGTVSITPADANDMIYYTTDGKKPTTASKQYTGPIKITGKCTVKAIAAHTGYTSSDVVQMRYIPYDTGMTLSKTAVSLAAGKKQEITITQKPTGSGEDFAVEWSSANEGIARVDTEIEEKEKLVGYEEDYDDDGNPVRGEPIYDTIEIEHIFIYGVNSGKTQIIASYTDYAGRPKSAVCNVTVTGKLEIQPTAVTMEEDTEEGKGVKLNVKKNQTGKPNTDIVWSSDDATVSVSEEGVVTAGTMADPSAPGKALVSASVTIEGTDGAEDTVVTAYCEVTVVPKSYDVTFYGWGGKAAKVESVYRQQNATAPSNESLSAAAPKGWVFKEWRKGPEEDAAPATESDWQNISEAAAVYASYERIPYTITYVTGELGTNPASNPTTYTVDFNDQEITILTLADALAKTPTDESEMKYDFAGWYRNDDYTGNRITEIPKGTTGDITLYAKWIVHNEGMRVDPIPDQTYTGKAIKPVIRVWDGEYELAMGRDYTVSYKNNTKAVTDTTPANKMPVITVKGKGNYGDQADVTFQIRTKDIGDSTGNDVITADTLYMAWNGKKLTPAPVLKRNGKALNKKKEYGVKEIKKVEGSQETVVAECIDEGEYKVVVEGKGNYSGTREIPLTVTKKILMNKVAVSKINDITWKSTGITKADINPKLIYSNPKTKKKITLVEGTDYEIDFDSSAVKIGTYNVKFIGKGDYAGEIVKPFKIKGKAINASNIKIAGIQKKDFNGANQEQALDVTFGKGKNAVALREGTDYTVTYENNWSAGKKATVIVTGINGYSGTVKKTFEIKAYSLKNGYDRDEVTVTLSEDVPYYYEKGGVKPVVTVRWRNALGILCEGSDYTLKYENNGKAAKSGDKKPPKVTITGKGNFSGKISLTYAIARQDIAVCSMTANDVMASAVSKKNPEGLTAAGKYKCAAPVVTDRNGKKLQAGTDYKKQYVYTDENGNVLTNKDKVAPGSILTVTATGMGSYQGTISTSYRIVGAQKSVAAAIVTLNKEAQQRILYSGEPITISKDDLVVKFGKKGEPLTKDQYTIVGYANNVKKGTATVTIQGVGEYGGTKTIKFAIKPKLVRWIEALAD